MQAKQPQEQLDAVHEPLQELVVGRIDRTNMRGFVYVNAFFGRLIPMFSWWGLAVVTRSTALATRAASKAEGTTLSDTVALVSKAWTEWRDTSPSSPSEFLDMLCKARVVDNVGEDGLLLQLFLGDAPLNRGDSGSAGAMDVPGLCGQTVRTVLLGKNPENDELHCMTTNHRFGVFDVCDALAAQGLRLRLVAATLPQWKLIEVPTRSEYEALASTRI